MAEFNISGRMSVKTLRAQFEKTYGLDLRIYNGSKYADEDATLASISSSKVDDFECRASMQIGNFETRFKDSTGIKVQVATLPNARKEPNVLVNNTFTLAVASEAFKPL